MEKPHIFCDGKGIVAKYLIGGTKIAKNNSRFLFYFSKYRKTGSIF
jgi:hypothetical protein